MCVPAVTDFPLRLFSVYCENAIQYLNTELVTNANTVCKIKKYLFVNLKKFV